MEGFSLDIDSKALVCTAVPADNPSKDRPEPAIIACTSSRKTEMSEEAQSGSSAQGLATFAAEADLADEVSLFVAMTHNRHQEYWQAMLPTPRSTHCHRPCVAM